MYNTPTDRWFDWVDRRICLVDILKLPKLLRRIVIISSPIWGLFYLIYAVSWIFIYVLGLPIFIAMKYW